jgi:hypothetical protein
MVKKDKDIDSLNVTAPRQIDLFEIMDEGPDRSYSNTIELYDALPKYNWAQKREHDDLQEAEITRNCTLRGKEYKVVIKPAILKKRGKTVLIFPGTREEVVEDALRKFAASGQAKMLENDAGVTFTLNQLQRELESMGHGFNIAEIKEAIMVCRGATLECFGDNDETLISSNFFPMIGLTTRKQYLKDGDAQCYVTFHPMVTRSILDLTFRTYNYKLGMELPSALARFIYKRMSHHWVQASTNNPYTPKLVSFLRQSPRGLSEDMYSNTRAMTNALKVLKKHCVISTYNEEVIKKGRKIVDVHYVIYPHDDFIKAMRKANFRQSEIRAISEGTKRTRQSKKDLRTIENEV